MAVKFYHFAPSPPSRLVMLTIKNLGLDVETKAVNLFAGEHMSGELAKINPQHTVPTIVDNDFVLWESKAIAEYLVDSKAPDHPLYPKDIKKRALINQRLYFDATVLFSRVQLIVRTVLFQGVTTVPEENVNGVTNGLKTLNGYLENDKWVTGSNVTLADLALLATVSTAIHMGFKINAFPNIVKWYANCKALPGFSDNDEGATMLGNAIKAKTTINN